MRSRSQSWSVIPNQSTPGFTRNHSFSINKPRGTPGLASPSAIQPDLRDPSFSAADRNRSATLNSIDSLNINSIDSIKFNNSSHDFDAAITDSPPHESPTWILSDLLQSFAFIKDLTDSLSIVTKGNDLVLLLRQYPGLKEDIVMKHLLTRIQFMFYHLVLEVRATGYRILRYSIMDNDGLSLVVQFKILIFIIITMSTSNTLVEKEQALKLVREFTAIPRGIDNLSIGVVKSIIAVVELGDEQDVSSSFMFAGVETICELALAKPELVFHAGGFQFMIQTMLDGETEAACMCIMVILKTLDSADTRKYLRGGQDLTSLLSFMSPIDSGADDRRLPTAKLQKIAFLITLLLKNWTGLLSVSHHNFRFIWDLVHNLQKRSPKLRGVIMDIIFDILRIRALPWLETSSVGAVLNVMHTKLRTGSSRFAYTELEPTSLQHGLVNHYLGLLVIILVRCGIMPLLADLVAARDKTSEKASLLLYHIYHMATTLIPADILNGYNLLPASPELTATVMIEKRARKQVTRKLQDVKPYVKAIDNEACYNLDDSEFKLMVTNTRVLTVKEYEEWNWTLLSTMIQGCLRNPKRFDDIEKSPRFLKRVISFYRPFKYRFCGVPTTAKNAKRYVTVGCQLLEALLSFDAGIRYLASSKLLPQLAEALAQVDQYSGINAKEPILLRKRLENTLSFGYLRFIGVLSDNPFGVRILEQWQIFNILQNIVDGSVSDESNNYLLVNLLSRLNYRLDSQARILLIKSVSISNTKVRMYLMENVVPGLLKAEECEDLSIRILVDKVYDFNKDISNHAIEWLYRFSQENEYSKLDRIIEYRPSVRILQTHEFGRKLLIHFLNTPNGFRYLHDDGYVDRELENTLKAIDSNHLDKIEEILWGCFFPYSHTVLHDVIPHHFLTDLLQTEDGLHYFQNGPAKIHLERILQETKIMARALIEGGYFDNSALRKLKQNLWIIGDISLSEYGIQLFDLCENSSIDKTIISVILELFEKSPVWQIRGIVFLQLGRIASTVEGIEILDENKWVSTIDSHNRPQSLCFPLDISLMKVDIENPYRDANYYALYSGGQESLEFVDNDEYADFEHVKQKVLVLISNLGSLLGRIERRARKELMLIKTGPTGRVFGDISLFLEVIKLIDKSKFSLQTRKFVFELFLDTKVLESLVKRERKNSGLK